MHRLRKIFLFLFTVALFYWVFFHAKTTLGGQISTDLVARLAESEPDQDLSILVYLRDPTSGTPYSNSAGISRDRKSVYSSVLNRLQDKAESSQKQFLERLNQLGLEGQVLRQKSYWIANLVALTAKKEIVQELADFPEVEIVYPDYPVTLIAPVESKPATAADASLSKIHQALGIRSVWQQGLTGKGSLVCILDTGVEGAHPALASNWRGVSKGAEQGWWDPFGTTFPEDAKGHGTHVAGIICARTDFDTIGIAPDAEWMAAAVVDRGTSKDHTVSNILAAFQWALNPDGDTGSFGDVPDVINNSWGFPQGVYPDCEELFWEAIDNVETAGVVVVFAAGNEGPEPSSLRLPADRSTTPYNSFAAGAVAATDSGFQIADFSSRGPSRCDSTKTKPELTAPGVEIYSTYRNGQYRLMSGTSMAAPFISGGVAILRQLDPDITVDQIKEALSKPATDLGEPGKDNHYGAGVVDIAAAVEYWKKFKEDLPPAAVLPQSFGLHQNFPNPFNASTTIRYETTTGSSPEQRVSLRIYNILGQRVTSLVAGPHAGGSHVVQWDGTNDHGEKVGSGIYFYRLEAGELVQTRKMAFLK
jgi:subtilisin family serine protease